MSITLNKGSGYSATYTSPEYPTLNDNWSGSFELYGSYPNVLSFSKALTRVSNSMTVSLSMEDVQTLALGLYTLIVRFSESTSGLSIATMDYATVVGIPVSDLPMTRLYGTMVRVDNQPAGKTTTKTYNIAGGGVGITYVLLGISISVAPTTVDTVSGEVIVLDPVTTTTNAVGYWEQYVIQGTTVKVTCPSSGINLTVDTTGETDIDLSDLYP